MSSLEDEDRHWLDANTYHAPPKPLSIGEVEDLHGIVASPVRAMRVYDHLEAAAGKKLPFGISFLDRALIGLLPTDLMLIGAGSGIGKTQTAVEIARSASVAGHRVLFLALEAEKEEIEMRLLYQLYADHYFADPERDRGVLFDFRQYRFNRLRQVTIKYERQAFDIFHRETKNLSTFYKGREPFTIENLEAKLSFAKTQGFDMVIVDHLHYFDLFQSRDSVAAMGHLMQQIRDLNLQYEIPIILVAHLRKDFHGFIPDLSDFRGSSDIGKQATLAVMISKLKGGYDPRTGLSKTVFTVPKSRTGSVPLAGIVDFSTRFNRYSSQYRLAYVNEAKEEIKELSREELPYWAKDCVDCKNGEASLGQRG